MTISPYYDPMIAKLIVWGVDRGAALRGLADALRQTQIAGVATNGSFLSRLVRHPKFVTGEIDTEFIARHEGDLLQPPGRPGERELLMAGLAVLAGLARRRRKDWESEKDFASPWSRSDGWRLNAAHATTVEFAGDTPETSSTATFGHLPGAGGEMRFTAGEQTVSVAIDDDGTLTGTLDGEPFAVASHLSDGELTLFDDGVTCRFRLRNPVAEAMRTPQSSGSISAPMPGRVLLVHVKERDEVDANAPLLVLEAMKMEHVLRAPRKGVVANVRVREGYQVKEGDQLIELGAEP